jgi:hypothetical protein
MKTVLFVLAFAFLCATPAKAQTAAEQEFNRKDAVRDISLADSATQAVRSAKAAGVFHYVSTHKELLFADALTVLAGASDAASSIHCQNISSGCYETNPILGPHPSPAKYWSLTMGVDAGFVTVNHIIWHKAQKQNRPLRHLMWAWTIPAVGVGVWDTLQNISASRILSDYPGERRRGR